MNDEAFIKLACAILKRARIDYIKAYRKGDDNTTDSIENDLFGDTLLSQLIGEIDPCDILADWRKKALDKNYKEKEDDE